MDKLDPKKDGSSKDILEENIQKLKEIFPEIITEGKIDPEKLKETLGDFVENKDERYSFNWNGKSKAKRLAQTPSMSTLRPSPEESVNWKDTENLFIEGDNLEVLKLLQKSYYKKVKMIYIDPPYNTGQQFIYPDDFKDNIKNYLELTGQVDKEGRKLSANAETSGRYHTDWLNMMYPRLKLARNLLRDDGVIFISIDDHEVANLKKMCDEIFGEENFISIFSWMKTATPPSLSPKVRRKMEWVLLYQKSSNLRELSGKKVSGGDMPLLNEGNAVIKLTFPKKTVSSNLNDGAYKAGKRDRVILHNDVQVKNKEIINDFVLEGPFKWTQETLLQEVDLGARFIVKTDKFAIRYIRERRKGKTPSNLITKKECGVGTNEDGAKELKGLLGKKIYDYPKPASLLWHLITIGTLQENDDIVLDFFAGSATTAHAVLDLNKEDGGNRKFIMVQFPELCDKESEAYKEGYKTIVDIGKERIRRVIKKIQKKRGRKREKDNILFKDKESSDKNKLNLGFKVFKLDSSNIKPWEATPENLEESLFDAVDNIKSKRKETDVLYELLFKYGLGLTVPIEERKIADKKAYVIGAGALIVCLADDITVEAAEGIVKLKDELNPEIIRVVFKDSGFKDDVAKTNATQILKQHGIEDVKSL